MSVDEKIRCWHTQFVCVRVCVCMCVCERQRGGRERERCEDKAWWHRKQFTPYITVKSSINNPTPFLPFKPFLTYDLCVCKCVSM